VEDLDRQIVPLLTQELLRLLLQDDPSPVVRVDDVVAFLERALDGAKRRVEVDRFLLYC
jgi:hypothetical protein